MNEAIGLERIRRFEIMPSRPRTVNATADGIGRTDVTTGSE